MPKSNDILQLLYSGEVCPAEDIGKGNTELTRLRGNLADERDRFIESLSEKQRGHCRKLEGLQNEYSQAYGKECFEHGYKLAVRLILEAAGENADNVQNGG